MTTITTSTTLGDLVTAYPSLAGELERRELDYCCGGARSLGEACSARGLDPLQVVLELSIETAGEEPADWATLGPVELVDHLVAVHHEYLWRELPRVRLLIDKVQSVHGERHPELVDVLRLFAELQADLVPHLVKEEQILFPMIRELASSTTAPSFQCGTVKNPISVMLSEHDRVGELLAQLRFSTNGYVVPADGCASYTACYRALEQLEADTHLHVHKENNVLFPSVVALEARMRDAG